MRDRVVDTTVRIDFQTNDANGAPVAPSSAFVAADFRIYKDGSATQKATTNGITVTSPFDSVVGDHLIEIDTNNDTGDDGFWALGSEYRVKINSAKTVDGQSQTGVKVGEFRLVSGVVELDSTTSTKIDNILEDTGVTLPTQIAGISSGGGDATLAKQEEILTALDELSAIQLAAVEADAGTIAGFPETLIIGDSYSADTGQIRIDIKDSVTEDPIDALGSLEFADADVTFTAFRPNDSARIAGTCEYVREPSSGTLTASYVLVTLLTSETAKGKAEYTYEGRLKFVWQGPSSSDETDEEQKTYKTTPFKFIANP